MFSVAFLVTFLCSSILAPARNTNAETVTESSSASGYTLSLSATPVVNLNVGVLEVPVMTVGVGTVSTSTTAPGGYKLYLSMAGTSNDLRRTGSDVDTISATTGTMADSSALGIGEWGYAIPSTTPNISATDFDTSYDIMESAYPSSKGFAAPPISTATAQLVTSTEGPNEKDGDNPIPDDIDVYYGINADNVTPLGTYTNSVLFTAIADSAQTAGATVSPTSASAAGGDTITVTSTLFSTSTIDANIYMLTSAAFQDVSANPSHISSYSSMLMTGCTQSSSTPVTYTGCVTPANDEGEGYHVYMDVPRYEKHYNANFEYKDPILFYQISNMQQMTPEVCASVTAPSSSSVTTLAPTKEAYKAATPGSVVPQVTLTDTRDQNTYIVRKLADNNCWMAQDLRLVGPFKPDKEDSNVSWTKSANSFELPASSMSGWCNSNSDASCVNRSRIYNPGSGSVGTYYSFVALSAGTGTKDMGIGDVTNSVCPKGWKLSTRGEYNTLLKHYGTTVAGLTNTNGPNYNQAGAIRQEGMIYSGRIQYFSGTVWPTSSNNASYGGEAIALTSYSDDAHVSSAYKCYGQPVRCIAEGSSLSDIDTMQEMNNSICANTPVGTSKKLEDTRDGNEYTVRKLADGRCWMVENLRLIGTKIDSTSSNLPEGKEVNIPSSDDSNWCTNQSSSCEEQLKAYDTGNSSYGVLYNWYTATATYGVRGLSSRYTVRYSICPKGWRLPIGYTLSNSEQWLLYYMYDSISAITDTNGFAFALAGYKSGSYTGSGTRGFYWSNTTTGSDYNAYGLWLNSANSDYRYEASGNRYQGNSVRCINDNDWPSN